MSLNLAEQLRAITLRHLLSVASIESEWSVRQAIISKALSGKTHPSQKQIVDLGDKLAEIFQSTGLGDRSQSSLSGGGKVWEVLVLWYLNLCFSGTHAVAVTGRFIPKSVKDALRVNYDNRSVKSDTDVVVLSLPELAMPELVEESQGDLVESKLLKRVDEIIGENFSRTGVIVVQTKTHWNDSAQTPMLWNIIYRQAAAGKMIKNGFSVGSGLWSVQNLGDFAYAFASVPTNPIALEYKADQTPVLRVKGMSAGAYWGHPSKNGVCWSLSEFFIKQFTRNGSIWPNVTNIGKGFSQSLDGKPICDVDAFKLKI